jgi:2,4-dienoyl-CoA reductase-like NADH-dependent reductase (Old Yellow Enzyme family)
MTQLQAPLTVPCGLTSANRVVLAPLTNRQSHADGQLSDDERRWLEMRAAGGFGIVTTCAAYVTQDGKAWAGQLGVHDDAMIPALRPLAASLRAHQSLGVVQLHHGGIRAKRDVSGLAPIGPSALSDLGPNYEPSQAATTDDIARCIEAFAAAAARVERAGLDGVELHGAHGYLISQFLSSTLNQRTDGWGGSLENRARFLQEILRATRRRVSPGFLVGVRLSPEDFGFAAGIDLDETIQVAQMLVEGGIDYVHLSLWDASKNTKKYPDRHALQMFRAVLPPSLPLLAAGNIWTADDAQRVLDLGADAVVLGRSAIANPDWPSRVAANPSWEPRRPPLSPAELAERGLNPTFIDYMRNWKGFVSE